MSTITLPWNESGTLWGVDVSSVNSDVPYVELASKGCHFLVAKLTDGIKSDPRGISHLMGARAAGVPRLGGYGFLHSMLDGAEQAKRLVERLTVAEKTVGILGMRLAIDWEDVNGVGMVGAARACKAMLDMAKEVCQGSGRRPHCYTFPSFIAQLVTGGAGSALTEISTICDLWIAHYRWDPVSGADLGLRAPHVPAPWTSWALWQIRGNRGESPLERPVWLDHSVFRGSAQDFDRLCQIEPDEPEIADTLPAPPNESSGPATTIADEVHAGLAEIDASYVPKLKGN